jgi:hypothetical protein
VNDHGGVDGIESGWSVEKGESGVSISAFNQNLLLKMIIIDGGGGGKSHASAYVMMMMMMLL